MKKGVSIILENDWKAGEVHAEELERRRWNLL
jgi:hypothetical protein